MTVPTTSTLIAGWLREESVPILVGSAFVVPFVTDDAFNQGQCAMFVVACASRGAAHVADWGDRMSVASGRS